MSCFSKRGALLVEIDCVCRAGLILDAEGGEPLGRKDHLVCEVVGGRYVQLHRKLCIVYAAERRPVETRVDMVELEISNRSRLPKVIHGIHHLPDIKDSTGRQ